jgi:hypothetical protein
LKEAEVELVLPGDQVLPDGRLQGFQFGVIVR